MNRELTLLDKLRGWGPRHLSDEELLAALLYDKKDTVPSIEIAAQIVSRIDDGLSSLTGIGVSELRKQLGITSRKAEILAVAIELGRRVKSRESKLVRQITSNEDVVSIFRPVMSNLEYEEFWVLLLSRANNIIDKIKVSQGGVSAVLVDHKLIIKRAVELLCSSIILVHNHPSGIALPSDEDRELTDKIVQAASLFDITVLDHMIITSDGSFSFRQKGLIE